ncbi:MAG: alpha-glucosidase/alpha-galactosidase [Deltaproteobacteria bacterium]|nr:alpha-glucosidase/alpha-galactosidase [Deltaproteobacteria bacterium]MBW2414101.1 alpha-glucosidase/alpha-galactosidase [Deltaproteobacteria bacterium]
MSGADEKTRGHAAHTRDAEERGLPGEFSRPVRIAMLGAGSSFTPRLVNDVLRTPGAERGQIALCDIDENRLGTMHALIEKLIASLGRDGWTVESSTKRTDLLEGSHYLVNCIEVSGVDCVRIDNDIPARYGVDQCIGDTIGPGGLFKGLRTIPVWLDVLRDAERLCPDAIVLNYTNPMSMMCLAAARESTMRVVGLCHSVQATSSLLARRAGVRFRDLEWECAGINHLAWFTRLRSGGRELYPGLFEQARADLAGQPADPDDAGDLVRKDMMLHFGAFITESSGHLSEYLPYYRKSAEARDAYCRDGYEGGSSFYADHWPDWRREADRSRLAMLHGDEPIDWKRSWEYASWIIEAREKDQPYRIHGNVPNRSRGAGPAIENLPGDGIVEVACMVDRNGFAPTVYGRLPPQMAAICSSHMFVYELGAQAAIERSVEAAVQALLLDPLTAAVCTPDEVRRMTLEMFEAEREFLPGFH